MLYYRINNKSYIERVIFVREPNTEEMTMSKFYAAVGGDLSDVLERLGDRAAALCEVLHTGSVPAPELLRQLTEEYCCVIDAIHELKSEI